MRSECTFRFHGELNAFLAPARRGRDVTLAIDGTPSIKDRIESLGVPHTEVDLLLVDGRSVDFVHRLRGDERVDVYPAALAGLVDAIRLRPQPTGEPRFVLDVHLGRLANYLRLLGFDVLWRNDYRDDELIALSVLGGRFVLTRDTALLKRAGLVLGAFLHATDPRWQLREVVDRFRLQASVRPFSRCARCNGAIEPLPPGDLVAAVPEAIAARHAAFSRCRGCGQVYWPGSHQQRLRQRLAEVGVAL